MKKVYLLVGLLSLLLCTNCVLASSLNTPVEKPVTVGSEIKRGYTSIDSIKSSRMIEIGDFCGYVSSIINKNVQSQTDTDAFYIGLYFEAWYGTAIKIGVGKNYYPKEALANMGKVAIHYYKKFRSYQSKLAITDNDLFTAIGFEDTNRAAKFFGPALEEWGSKAKAQQE